MKAKLLFLILSGALMQESSRAQDAIGKPAIFVCGDSTAKNFVGAVQGPDTKRP